MALDTAVVLSSLFEFALELPMHQARPWADKGAPSECRWHQPLVLLGFAGLDSII